MFHNKKTTTANQKHKIIDIAALAAYFSLLPAYVQIGNAQSLWSLEKSVKKIDSRASDVVKWAMLYSVANVYHHKQNTELQDKILSGKPDSFDIMYTACLTTPKLSPCVYFFVFALSISKVIATLSCQLSYEGYELWNLSYKVPHPIASDYFFFTI